MRNLSKPRIFTVGTRFVSPISSKIKLTESLDEIWRISQLYPEDLQSAIYTAQSSAISHDARICILLVESFFHMFLYTANANRVASASKIRTCQRCRNALIQTFQMPEKWWSSSYKTSNGYFGCETTRQAGVVTGFSK